MVTGAVMNCFVLFSKSLNMVRSEFSEIAPPVSPIFCERDNEPRLLRVFVAM